MFSWQEFTERDVSLFTENVIRSLINTKYNVICHIEDYTPPQFDSFLQLSACYNIGEKTEDEVINSDGIRWSKKKDSLGSEMKPRKNTISVDGRTFRRINCSSPPPATNLFKKYMAIEEATKLCWILFLGSSHDVIDYTSLKVARKKLSKEEALMIRKMLEGRTVLMVYQMLGGKYSKRQIKNQQRNVLTTVKLNRGPRPVTNPADLCDLSRMFSHAYHSSHRNSIRFIYFNKSMLGLFLKSCPTYTEITTYRNRMDGIENWRTADLNKHLADCKVYTCGGIDTRVASIIELDTTFGLSNGYISVTTGFIPVFRTRQHTKSSPSKLRHVVLGFMFHSSKHKSHFEDFSGRLNEILQELDPKKIKKIQL